MPLDPRLLYVGPIQPKGQYLSLRDTCLDPYSYLSVLCVLCLAAYGAARYLSILCSVRQLPTRTMQYWAAFTALYSAFCVLYIVFVQFCNYI